MTERWNLPAQQGMLPRPRLHSLIEEGLGQPLLVLLAGPGYGKTQAMVHYLQACRARVLWMRLGGLDNLPSHFWSHFVRSLQGDFAGLSVRLEQLEFPDTLSKFDAFSRLLAEEIDGEGPAIWVMDDFGELRDRGLQEFFRRMAEMDRRPFRLVLLSNDMTSMESVAFLTSRRALILGQDLRFTREEIRDLFELYHQALEPDELGDMERQTEGWPLPLHLLALQRRDCPQPVRRDDGLLTHQAVTALFEERFFAAYPRPVQRLLLKLSLPDSFSGELAAVLCGKEPVELELLDTHAFLNKEPATGKFFFHYLYRLFLKGKEYLLSREEKDQVWRQAGGYYAAAGSTMEAIACYRSCGDYVGMLHVIGDFVRARSGIDRENALFLKEHLALLSPEQVWDNPVADYLTALVSLELLELDRCEAILLSLQERLAAGGSPGDRELLGDVLAMQGSLHMMRNQEDFGRYYKAAVELLPKGSRFVSRQKLFVKDSHNFSMADRGAGARERMERAVHFGVPWATRFLGGGMGGMELIFSAEASYLSFDLEAARRHAYRAIYKAEAHGQHDLVCNGHCILARIGLLEGDLDEMSRQVRVIADYAEGRDIGALKDIRDTALGWYAIKLHDYGAIPKSILTLDHADKPMLNYGRPQIVYANFLINRGEYAKLIGMLEHPKGLYLTSGIWPDRICLLIMLAIGYASLGNPADAVEALWNAYDMCFENGLTTLFIEAKDHMCRLIALARRQRTHAFDPDWLDHVEREAGAYEARASAVRAAFRKRSAPPAGDNPLTNREREILQALARGLTREEIAVEFYISVNTVKSFIRSIYNKLDAANRAEAVSIAMSRGFLSIPPSR